MVRMQLTFFSDYTKQHHDKKGQDNCKTTNEGEIKRCWKVIDLSEYNINRKLKALYQITHHRANEICQCTNVLI